MKWYIVWYIATGALNCPSSTSGGVSYCSYDKTEQVRLEMPDEATCRKVADLNKKECWIQIIPGKEIK